MLRQPSAGARRSGRRGCMASAIEFWVSLFIPPHHIGEQKFADGIDWYEPQEELRFVNCCRCFQAENTNCTGKWLREVRVRRGDYWIWRSNTYQTAFLKPIALHHSYRPKISLSQHVTTGRSVTLEDSNFLEEVSSSEHVISHSCLSGLWCFSAHKLREAYAGNLYLGEIWWLCRILFPQHHNK